MKNFGRRVKKIDTFLTRVNVFFQKCMKKMYEKTCMKINKGHSYY